MTFIKLIIRIRLTTNSVCRYLLSTSISIAFYTFTDVKG